MHCASGLCVFLRAHVQVRTRKKPRTCPGWKFGFPANLGVNIRIKAKSAGSKIEHRRSTESGVLGLHFTGRWFHRQCLSVGGLYNLFVRILPAQASLKGSIVRSLQDVFHVAMAHDSCFYLSLGSCSYHIKFSVFGFILLSGMSRDENWDFHSYFLFPFQLSCLLFGRGG